MQKTFCWSNSYSKIIVEESINAREIECAVLGNEDVEASILGEILPAEEFYSFDAKYSNPESKTKMPADLSKEQTESICLTLQNILLWRMIQNINPLYKNDFLLKSYTFHKRCKKSYLEHQLKLKYPYLAFYELNFCNHFLKYHIHILKIKLLVLVG